MNKYEYQLKEAPVTYTRYVDSVFIAGAVALFTLIIMIAVSRASQVSPVFITIVASVFAVSLSWVIYVLRVKSRAFPDWREYHEKILAPKNDDDLLQRGLRLTLNTKMQKLDQYLSGIFAAIGFGILVTMWFVGSTSVPLIVIASVTLGICLWNLLGLKKVADVPGPHIIEADARTIRMPIAAFDVVTARRLAKSGRSPEAIAWEDIEEWIVVDGGSDDPDVYQLLTMDGKQTEIYRSSLKGKELKLLEFVRAAGVPVRLKGSIVE